MEVQLLFIHKDFIDYKIIPEITHSMFEFWETFIYFQIRSRTERVIEVF